MICESSCNVILYIYNTYVYIYKITDNQEKFQIFPNLKVSRSYNQIMNINKTQIGKNSSYFKSFR